MPLSSNAPFSEFGQSMILRDIEQIYLALNGAGVGSAGDGQTQDQAVAQTQETGDSGGITDLSGLATVDYVNQLANQLLDSIPTVTYPISIANGGTGATSASLAIQNIGFVGNSQSLYTSGSGTFTAPAGTKQVLVIAVGAGGGAYTATGIACYVSATSGGATTQVVNRVSGGGGGGAVVALIDYSTSGPLSYNIGAGGTTGGTPTSGGASSVTGTSTAVTAGGGLLPVSVAAPGRGGGEPANTSWTGAGVLWGYSVMGHHGDGYTTLWGFQQVGYPGIHLASPSGYPCGQGASAASSAAGTDGAIMFIY